MANSGIISFDPEPSLLPVIKEIAEKLLQDDWYRRSTQDGTQAYYVVGVKAQSEEVNGLAEFSHNECPLPAPIGPLQEAVVRSQVADNRTDFQDHLDDVMAKLRKAGAPPSTIDGILAGNFEAFFQGFKDWCPSVEMPDPEERITLLNDLFEALKFSRADATSIDRIAHEDPMVRIWREKNCLKELANKYPKIVKRWGRFATLSFTDPQLLEASKAFLYGFNRACIVLCASTVEQHLKRVCGFDPDDKVAAWELIDVAERSNKLSHDNAGFCEELFKIRNKAVHRNGAPDSHLAGIWLDNARMLVAALVEETELF